MAHSHNPVNMELQDIKDEIFKIGGTDWFLVGTTVYRDEHLKVIREKDGAIMEMITLAVDGYPNLVGWATFRDEEAYSTGDYDDDGALRLDEVSDFVTSWAS